MNVVWVVDVAVDEHSARRLRFGTEDEALECWAAATRAGFAATCERVASRSRVGEECISTST